jgi:flagellar biosynthetic protein FliQ
MTPTDAIDLSREAMMMCLLIGAPVLLVGMLVGLIIGLMQALTQVQDQTVSFVPKIVAMIAALGLSLPWVLQQMMSYSTMVISNIPNVLTGQ